MKVVDLDREQLLWNGKRGCDEGEVFIKCGSKHKFRRYYLKILYVYVHIIYVYIYV